MDIGKLHRKAVESLYRGKCTIYEHKKVKNEKTKLTGYEDVMVLEDQPCKLSFKEIHAAVQGEAAATATQVIKLFLSPNVIVMPGSKVTVIQDGVKRDYTSSGVPAVYQSHQEIILKLEDERV